MWDEELDARAISALRELQQQDADRPDPPPLRIHHWMLCVVVAAMQLAILHSRMPSSVVQQMPLPAIAFNAVYEGLGAISVTLGILSIYWHLKGYAGLVQPGQWLLFSSAIAAFPFYIVTLPLRRWNGGVALWIADGLYIVYHVVPAVFFLLCAWKVADTRPWRIVFAFIAATMVVTTSWVSHVLSSYWITPLSVAVAIPILAQSCLGLGIETWAAVTDVTSRRTRFWTHWAGIGLAILNQIMFVVGGALTLLRW
jgi:hypothetical protein